MGAVVLADLAVEIAAKAAVLGRSLEGRPRVEKDWPVPDVLNALLKLWQKREGTKADVPEVLEARRLHDLRNTVQHDGVVPSRDQVVQQRLRARDLLSWVATAWFGEETLESISRARLIKNKAVQNEVEQAERAAAGEDYSTAAKHLSVAFEMARRELRAGSERWYRDLIHSVNDNAVGQAIAEVRTGSGDTSIGWPKFTSLLRGVVHQLDTLNDQVEALSLGARASDYTWFKRNFPQISQVMSHGQPRLGAYEPVEPVTRAVYLRGLDFVTTTALHWQEFPGSDPPTRTGVTDLDQG
jgi:hypothetical protein